LNRREFIRSLVVSSILAGIGFAGIGEMILLGKRGSKTASPTPSQVLTSVQQTTSGAPSGYVFVAALSALSGKSYAYFMHPTAGNAIIVNVSGQWKVFSAPCTHRPCIVSYSGTSIYCPCHGGTFSTANGAVTGGPPPRPLPEYGVQIMNGDVYVSTAQIN
jgi:Rieske Fe-S protein